MRAFQGIPEKTSLHATTLRPGPAPSTAVIRCAEAPDWPGSKWEVMSVKTTTIAALRWSAFNRWRSLGICSALTAAFLTIEIYQRENAAGLFAASGAFFTLGGFLLGIKNSAIFHRVDVHGNPLPLVQKYWSVRGAFGFADQVSEEEMRARVDPVELDEIWGCGMVFFGTLLWGFGSFLIKLIPA